MAVQGECGLIPGRTARDGRTARHSCSRHAWAVELRATGEFIGDCGLVYVEGKGPEIEVAYHFAKEWWGRGLATEAARACLDYGFRELGLREIIAICFPEHVASRRVMEKAGMRYVGPARYYELDLVKYVANDRR